MNRVLLYVIVKEFRKWVMIFGFVNVVVVDSIQFCVDEG
jgi:hypothetical protein